MIGKQNDQLGKSLGNPRKLLKKISVGVKI